MTGVCFLCCYCDDGVFVLLFRYCNQRVLKYSPTGELLFEITNKQLSQGSISFYNYACIIPLSLH